MRGFTAFPDGTLEGVTNYVSVGYDGRVVANNRIPGGRVFSRTENVAVIGRSAYLTTALVTPLIDLTVYGAGHKVEILQTYNEATAAIGQPLVAEPRSKAVKVDGMEIVNGPAFTYLDGLQFRYFGDDVELIFDTGEQVRSTFFDGSSPLIGYASVIKDDAQASDGVYDHQTDIMLNPANSGVPVIDTLTADLLVEGGEQFDFSVGVTDVLAAGTSPGRTLYDWDLDGDGVFGDFLDPSGSYAFDTAGVREVGVRVSNSYGFETFGSFSVDVQAAAPSGGELAPGNVPAPPAALLIIGGLLLLGPHGLRERDSSYGTAIC